VTVTDAFNNPVSGATVSFAAPGSGASATLSSLTATTDANGHAAVNATANGTAGSYDVVATSPGASGSAVFVLTNVTGAVGQITFVQQPTNTMAGATITPPVTVHVADSQGNAEVGVTVTIHLQGGTGPLNGTLTAITDANGQATFSNLSINTAGSYQLVAVSGSISAVSNAFMISASTATVLISVYDGDGQSADAGTMYAAPLKAQVTDRFGNVLAGASVTFSAPATGPSVTFNGSATVNTDSSGIAVSPTMTANTQTGPFQAMAVTTGAVNPALFNLTNLAATANKLAFVQQPTDSVAGATIAPPVTVQLEDSFGNAVHTAGVAVTLQSNMLARRNRSLGGTLTENTDANGLATFADLSISQTGTYQLTASAANVASATSNPFNITAGISSRIVATGGTPQSALINTAYDAPLQATVTDADGNPISGVTVTFSAPTSGPSGTFNGQLTATATTSAQGIASTPITANGIAGSFGVTASSSAVTGSAIFSLTNLPVGSSSLVFVQQPSNTPAGQVIAPPVTVQVRDAFGNPEQVAGIPVLLSLSSGTGTLLGTVVQLTNATGLATFNDLRIGATRTKTLRATASQETPATSNPFQITAGAAAGIAVFSGAPQATTVGTPFGSLLQAQVTDIAGNPVSGVSVTLAAAASGPSGTFAAVATVTTDANGIATAPILTANSTPGNWVATAAAAGITAPAVFSLTNLPTQATTITVNPSTLVFRSEINQSAPPGQTVQISATGSWTLSSSAPWLSALPASGTGSGQITVSVNPAGLGVGTYTGSIAVMDSTGGVALVFVTYTVTSKPALVTTPPTLVFTASTNTVTPGAQTLTATSSSRQIVYSISTTGQHSEWRQLAERLRDAGTDAQLRAGGRESFRFGRRHLRRLGVVHAHRHDVELGGRAGDADCGLRAGRLHHSAHHPRRGQRRQHAARRRAARHYDHFRNQSFRRRLPGAVLSAAHATGADLGNGERGAGSAVLRQSHADQLPDVRRRAGLIGASGGEQSIDGGRRAGLAPLPTPLLAADCGGSGIVPELAQQARGGAERRFIAAHGGDAGPGGRLHHSVHHRRRAHHAAASGRDCGAIIAVIPHQRAGDGDHRRPTCAGELSGRRAGIRRAGAAQRDRACRVDTGRSAGVCDYQRPAQQCGVDYGEVTYAVWLPASPDCRRSTPLFQQGSSPAISPCSSPTTECRVTQG
jgi:adhesin/invasin